MPTSGISNRTSPELRHQRAFRRGLGDDGATLGRSPTAAARQWLNFNFKLSHYRRLRGAATYRLVRYPDAFVVLVAGTPAHAEALRDRVVAMLAPRGVSAD